MKDEVLLYREMCDRESVQTLQRGMNYRLNPQYSVLLMSQRNNAPYNDRVHDDGLPSNTRVMMFQRHWAWIQKKHDQTEKTRNGTLTQNGYFALAVRESLEGTRPPELVKIYEKILPGIWSEKGFFKLVDYKTVVEVGRSVFRFILQETEISWEEGGRQPIALKPRSRVIPTFVKKIVWERDNGRCVICGEEDELHFDHDLPYSKGGTSITPDNVKILCARHNLTKSDKII